jgi:hypothetical protein
LKKDNAIFTLLIVVILGIISLTFYGVTKFNEIEDQSVAEIIPKEIIISNLNSNRATISWITSEDATSSIRYGEGVDDYFASKQITEATKIHYYDLTELNPEVDYYYEITVDGQVFTDETKIFTFKTLAVDDSISTPSNLLITLPSDFASSIIYVHSSDGATTSTTISSLNKSENALIDISSIRDESTGSLYDLENKKLLVSVTNELGLRKESIIDATAQSIDFTAATSLATEYNPEQTFEPNVVAEEPEEPEPEPEEPVEEPTEEPEEPVEEPEEEPEPDRDVDVSEVTPQPKPLPDTAINANVLGLIQIGLGVVIILIGVSLYRTKE